jgi:hypothetical protein
VSGESAAMAPATAGEPADFPEPAHGEYRSQAAPCQAQGASVKRLALAALALAIVPASCQAPLRTAHAHEAGRYSRVPISLLHVSSIRRSQGPTDELGAVPSRDGVARPKGFF